jgi:predicted aminopeptidase
VLRQRLVLVNDLREFARIELALPVDGHYVHYVDLKRPAVVWNVQAAPEFSLEAKTWWYPIVGSLDYRGYFSERGAHQYGEWLKRKGFDVYYGRATAYSTLGWFRDPVLNTFLFGPEPELAEVLFHELGHQQVFAPGDTDFNEAFATTVGEEGARRWLRARGGPDQTEGYEIALRRNREFVALVMQTRGRLEQLYGDYRDSEGKLRANRNGLAAPPDELRRQKTERLERLREEYQTLKSRWGGFAEYDAWFQRSINNAKLNSVANYYDLVPGFERLLALNAGDLTGFYHEAARLAKMPKEDRHQWLRILAQGAATNAAPAAQSLSNSASAY